MQCDRCKITIEEGEELELQGQTLCEECYMDQLSPPRMCDPWAVYTAKSFSDDPSAKPLLTEQQDNILAVLKETGGVGFEELANRLGIKPSELERELATLRHMEKIKAAMRNGEKILVLW